MTQQPKKRVYVETSIPSFYHETRMESGNVVRREATREWWARERHRYEVVTSRPVLVELEKGSWPRAQKEAALAMMAGIPLLPVEARAMDIVEYYVRSLLMPKDIQGDALHLAIASMHHCHFLLTWNCRNLANANKFEHIRHANTTLGLFVPILTTPLQLMTPTGGLP